MVSSSKLSIQTFLQAAFFSASLNPSSPFSSDIYWVEESSVQLYLSNPTT